MRFLFFIFIYLLIPQPAKAKNTTAINNILSMQERADFIDEISQKRVQQLLPRLMKETNIDMWLLISREYNEDPILKTLLPARWLSARRTTILGAVDLSRLLLQQYV